jgi:cation:H+ antiporter
MIIQLKPLQSMAIERAKKIITSLEEGHQEVISQQSNPVPTVAELYDVGLSTINEHIKKIFADHELEESATIRKFRIVQTEGSRQVSRDVVPYNLQMIIAVDFKVNNQRAVRFRVWANQIVEQYMIKGWVMDVERLKNNETTLTQKYFDKQLEKIREIRLSERNFYQKLTDIYAMAIGFTMLLVKGALVIVPLAIKRMTLLVEIPYMIFITAVFLAMGITGAGISRPEGALLLLLFVIYLTYLFILAKKSGTDNVIEGKPIWKLAMMMLAGIIAVVWGSDITVNAATGLARAAGLSERFIGLTIVALGTSLPELFTSVTAAVRGNADIAVGNIVGSNIFNILFIMGVAALAAPLGYGTAFVMDGAIAIMAGALLWLLALKRRRLRAAEGLVMLLVYGVYVAYLWIL